ncbi:MAG TPA: permease-like cell division protein FtsX [Vicinamibacteria bacterium]|jgi:cell division transport system permease protein
MRGTLRAVAYFLQEAAQSLWRSRLIGALSVGTIAISLFLLGAFLAVASNLAEVVDRWTRKVQVTIYLRDGVDPRDRDALVERLRQDPAVEMVEATSRDEALARFRAMFRDLAALPEDLGTNPFPASLEATLKPGHHGEAELRRLHDAFRAERGVEEVQYDLLWIQRLGTAVRLVRGLAAVMGFVLLLAGVFTISNVIRLTVYARQDELDIMRLVGATPSYVKGPFVMEGMIQGALGGLLAVGLLWVAFQAVARDVVAASDLLGRAVVFLPATLCAALVLAGMAMGVVGSLVSLGRSQV